ncbi:hypothetical protein TNCV_4456591 [Trichonephila clavipes]|nr:hypothetical protein TNCV_4456591 [Trichonephila clavipes]
MPKDHHRKEAITGLYRYHTATLPPCQANERYHIRGERESSCIILSVTALGVASFIRDGFVGCIVVCNCFAGCVLCLTAWLPLWWIDGTTIAAVLFARPGSPMEED